MPSTSLTGDPNTWPFSRPSLAAHGRESGLPLVNYLRNIGSPPKLPRQFENQGLLPFTICDPLSVPSLRMEDRSMVTFLSCYALLLSSSTSESDGLLSSPQRVFCCGILCSPVFSLCSSPCISPPVSLTRYGMLVLWLVTVLQGPCQIFVLRESAGLALFRSLTVPLVGSVPSGCCCFTLRCPFLFPWPCGTG